MGILRISTSVFCLAALLAGAAARAADRPNIVFIFSDDHAYQAVSAYGGPLAKIAPTPHIDRLAREGMLFDCCYVTNSLCGPSRAAVQTGLYSHRNGFYSNGGDVFDGSQTTFPKLLQKAGYQTAIIGKWHLVSDPQGFNYWNILYGQGQYYNPPMNRMGRRVKYEGYTTDVLADLAMEWLEKKRDPARPFVLMYQNKAPHREWEPSLKYLHLFDDLTIPEPDTLFDDYAGRGKAERTQDMTIAKTMNARDLKLMTPGDLNDRQRKVWEAAYAPKNAAFEKAGLSGRDLVRWKYQRYMKDYLRCIRSIDDGVGRILDYLDRTGLAANTIVVYTSDQGFYLGEHGWFDKRWIFAQSLGTPLVVRWPGVVKPGTRNRHDIVSNLDFAETFCEVAGVPVPAEMQGRSLVPVLQGRTPNDWRKYFYYHYYEWPAVHNVRPHYGVASNRYKLVKFYGDVDYWELFDLRKDPEELTSVYNDPAYAATRKALHAELDRLQKKLGDTDPEVPLKELRRRAVLKSHPLKSAKADAAKRKIVFVAGSPSHGYGDHEYHADCLLWSKWLKAAYPNLETVVTRNGWPKDPHALDAVDAIVISSDGGGGQPILPHLDQVGKLMRGGVGLACIHYAVEVPKGQAGDLLKHWIGGYFETFWSVNPIWKAEFREFPDHPVARGLKPFAITDEWYYNMRFLDDMQGITPILTATPPDNTRREGHDAHGANEFVRAHQERAEHLAWVYQRPDGGRGFGFTGGHSHWNWANRSFRTVVLNGIAWVAKLKVPPGGVPSQKPTFAELAAHLDKPQPANFDRERVYQLIESW